MKPFYHLGLCASRTDLLPLTVTKLCSAQKTDFVKETPKVNISSQSLSLKQIYDCLLWVFVSKTDLFASKTDLFDSKAYLFASNCLLWQCAMCQS